MVKKFSKKKAIFIYLIFFIIALSFFNPSHLSFFKKNIVGFTLILLVTYGLTLNLKKSFKISLFTTLILGTINYFDTMRNLEYFKDDEEKIRVNKDTKNVAPEDLTKDFNGIDTNLDLDKLLSKDIEDIESENKKVSGTKTLEELQELLDKASEDSELKVGKKIKDYTPSEAQKATFRLIDTTQQLRDTVEEMTPAIKNGMKLLKMIKQFK